MKVKNKSKTIEDYLIKYFKDLDTRKTIRWFLWKYFELINDHPEGYFKKYNKKQLEEHLWTFIEAIEDMPPRTQSNLFSAIKKYFERHGIEIKTNVWEDLKNRNDLGKSRSTTKKATPTTQNLKKILSHANLKQKTLFMFCATTGIRIGEALQLTFDDIDMEKRKVQVRPEVAKGRFERFTFFTPETKELLDEWKNERLKLLKGKHIKSLYVRQMLENQGYDIKMIPDHKEKNKNGEEVTRYKYVVFKDGKQLTKDELIGLDNRVFPFTEKNGIAMWTNLIEKAGEPFNQKDKNPKFKKSRYMYNQHCLRRFWFTQISSSRMNSEYFNFIGGHMSELSSTYTRYLDSPIWVDKIKAEYDKHMSCLLVYETPADTSDIREQITELQKENEALKQEMDRIRMELLEVKMKQVQELQRAELEKKKG